MQNWKSIQISLHLLFISARTTNAVNMSKSSHPGALISLSRIHSLMETKKAASEVKVVVMTRTVDMFTQKLEGQ